MAGRIVLDGLNPALDSNGKIDAGATITFYQNLSTSILQTVYSDNSLATPLANPMACNAAGRFPDPVGNGAVWAPDDLVYTIKMEFTNGDIITRDGIVAGFSTRQEVPVYLEGTIADGETFPVYLPTLDLRLPEDLVESRFEIAGVLPTATRTFTLKKNGSAIGTVAFATDGTPTVSFNSAIDILKTDDFSVDGPSPADGGMTNVALNFAFQRI